MQYKNHSPQGFKLKTGGAAVLLAVGSLVSAGVAQANSAAGEVLTNVVTVDYADAGGTAQIQVFASVTVTIDHLASATLTGVVTAQTTGSSSTLPADYTARLTNTGNGSDSYNFTTTPPSSVDNCSGGGTLGSNSFSTPTPATLTLGASVTDASALLGATSISIPYDGTDDGTTRGLGDNATITIAGNDYVITAGTIIETAPAATTLPTPPALGTTTFTISPGLVGAITAGTQVGEYTTITYGATGNAGTTSSGASGCTHVDTVTATGTTATGTNAQSTPSVDFTTTVTPSAVLLISKFVRNVDVPAKNTGGVDLTYPSGGNEYRTSGKVSGNPGDVLEYAVQIQNTSAGLATNVIFQDTLPPFTSIDIDTVTGGTQAAVAIDQNTNETLDVAIDDTDVYTATSETETIGIVDQDIIAQSGQGLRIFPGTDTSVTDANETGADASTGTGGTGGGVPPAQPLRSFIASLSNNT
jgi:uncharacterized repeat protein (TIGR01451 family)